MSITSKLVPTTSAAVTAMAALLLLLGPNVPGVKEAAAAINPAQSQSCAVHYYAFDEGKETAGAFGPSASFDPSAPDMTSLLAQLKERRECDTDGLYDPALVAAQYTVTANATLPDGNPANLTSQKVSYADMTHFGDMLASNYDLYKSVVAELAHLESTATPSIEGVSKGQNSLYMTPNGNGGVLIKQGLVANDGHNLVFTYANGATVKYRLECGFQPNWPSPIPNVPECVGEECSPPPYYPPPVTETCPPGSTGPYPDCDAKNGWSTPENEGWTPRGLDNGLTDGNESRNQHDSGETRGNAGEDQVPHDTGNGSTTPDTVPSDQGGPIAGDSGEGNGGSGNAGGDDRKDDVQDKEHVKNDEGGTNGNGCVPTEFVSC